MNRLNITGRLTKDIELRTRQDGKTFGMFTVAVNRGFGKQQQNNGEPTADFFTCFMNNVEKVAPYLLKGTQVGIDGSIHINNKKDQNGNYSTQVSVSVQQLELLGSKNSNSQPSATGAPVSVAPQTPAPMAPNYPPQPKYPPQAPQAPSAPAYVPQAPASAPVSAPPVPPVAQAPQTPAPAPAPAQYQAPPAGLADEDIPF